MDAPSEQIDAADDVTAAKGEKQDIVRVTRILEYVGPRAWVERTLAQSSVKGTYILGSDRWIHSAVLGDWRETATQEKPKAE